MPACTLTCHANAPPTISAAAAAATVAAPVRSCMRRGGQACALVCTCMRGRGGGVGAELQGPAGVKCAYGCADAVGGVAGMPGECGRGRGGRCSGVGVWVGVVGAFQNCWALKKSMCAHIRPSETACMYAILASQATLT